MNPIKDLRKKYARLVTDTAGVDSGNTELIAAFASVPREDFLGPGPWHIRSSDGYTTTNDKSRLYQDVLVALDSQEQINNGQAKSFLYSLISPGSSC